MSTNKPYFTTAVATRAKSLMSAMKQSLAKPVLRLERGDADSGGSTLRTLGVVTLIVLVVGIIGVAILLKANESADVVNNVVFPW